MNIKIPSTGGYARDFQEWSPLKAAHEVANFAEQLGINGVEWQRGGMDVMDRMFSILIILLMSGLNLGYPKMEKPIKMDDLGGKPTIFGNVVFFPK